MRVLALDVGDRRIGVAMSDPTGVIATPLTTIRRVSEKRDQQAVAELVREHGVDRVVVGLPKTLRGEIGPQAQRVLRFGERLAEVLDIPVVYWDERYSTVDAQSIMRAQGRGRADRVRRDEVAAAVILQSYLDALHESREGDE